jgi:truncated hemoglobin YjbI
MRSRRVEQQSLYERLGVVKAIAMVVDRFSDAIVENRSSRKTRH